MIKLIREAIHKEPLGFIAIFAALVPFFYDVFAKHTNKYEYALACQAPKEHNIRLAAGFLYYVTSCVYSNSDENSISILQIDPVVINGKSSKSLIKELSFIPNLSQEFFLASEIDALSVKSAELPAFLRPGEAFNFPALFAFPIGGVRFKDSCVKTLPRDLNTLAYPACHEGRDISLINTILEGVHYGLDYADNFGIELILSNGLEVVTEFDITNLFGFQCNVNIRQLNCENFQRSPISWSNEIDPYYN